MPQVTLNKKQLASIVNAALDDESGEMIDTDSLECFMEDLSNLICSHFGGEFVKVDIDEDGTDDTVTIDISSQFFPTSIYKKV